MQKNNHNIISIITGLATGAGSMLAGYFIGRKSVIRKLDSWVAGNLNVVCLNDGNHDVLLQLKNKETIEEIKKNRYVVFSVTLLEEDQKCPKA